MDGWMNGRLVGWLVGWMMSLLVVTVSSVDLSKPDTMAVSFVMCMYSVTAIL